MASLIELERRSAEIRLAELDASTKLAEYLRGAVLDIPTESPMGLIFVRAAQQFELWGTGGDPTGSVRHELERLVGQVEDVMGS